MLRKLSTTGRLTLRALGMGLAAMSLAWGITLTEGFVAAGAGAVLGVVLGEVLGRSRLRLPVALGGLALLLVVATQAASLAVTTEFVPATFGPANALALVGVLRFGSLALAGVATLRLLAVRRPSLLALELGAIVAAFATVFSAHRDGIIARPLWLSDWAWQQGIDPAQVLMVAGGVAVALLALLLVVESRSGRALSSLLALAALAVLAVLCLNVTGMPAPQAGNDLGLTNPQQGEPPHPTQADGGRGPNGQGQDSGARPQDRDGGQGAQPDAGDGGGANTQDGGDGGGASAGDGGDGGASGGPDGGDGGAAGAADGGDGSTGLPPLERSDGSVGLAPPPQDGGSQRPPQLSEDEAPSNSPAPMAVVLLDDDYSPPAQAYYFRQDVWSQYNGARLVRTTRQDADLDTPEEYPTAERQAVRDPPPATGRTRVSARVAMLVEHTRPFALEGPAAFAPSPNPNPQRFVRSYRFESLAQTIPYRQLLGRTAGDHRWAPEVRAYYLQGPADPRYRELARRIVNQRLPERMRHDPFAQALAIKMYLDHELIYSTRQRHAGVADPTADFLFGNRTGYCVHFAHSAVFLWRALGLPARIGTGYQTDEDNRHGGSTILVRGGDAHAWPELSLDGLGWIVLDISAERNLDPPGQPVDDDLQRILGEMARQLPPDPTVPPRQPRPPPTHYGRDLGQGALALLVAALAVLYAIKLWRRVVPRFAGARTLPRVGYRRALDWLAEAGLARRFGETREDFARRVGGRAPSFAKLTDLHLAARLGNPHADPALRPEFSLTGWRAAMQAVRRELAGSTPAWRRWLGRLHPGSFLDAR